MLIGGGKLFFYITGINLYVDELLFPGKIGEDRIVAIASVCFILTGISLLLVHTKGKSNERLSDTILLLLIGFSVFSILGYFFQVNLFYGLFTYVPMAIHAAICFLFISLCIFFYNSDKGLMKSLTSTLAGSIAARRLIPAAILVPVLLGILRTVAHQEADFYHRIRDNDFGIYNYRCAPLHYLAQYDLIKQAGPSKAKSGKSPAPK